MANTRSAKKAIRGSAKKREHNSFWTRRISAAEKGLTKLIQAGAGADILKESFQVLQKVVDKAAKENVIKKNKAARIKSKLAKKISADAQTATKPTTTKSTKAKPKSSKPKSK